MKSGRLESNRRSKRPYLRIDSTERPTVRGARMVSVRSQLVATAVLLLLLVTLASAVPAVSERSTHVSVAFGSLLRNFGQIYAALINGISVRYYADFASCETRSDDLPSQGGEVDYFEVVHVNETYDYLRFTSEAVKLRTTTSVTVWSEYLVTSDESGSVKVITFNPVQYAVVNSSYFICDVNDGGTGSLYFFSVTSPPHMLTSYDAVDTALRAGFVVTYAVSYQLCSPTPATNSDGGGAIGLYSEITASNASNQGLAFSGMFKKTLPQSFQQRTFSLFRNGLVIVDQLIVTMNYFPISSSSISCQMNDGTNGGAVSFFSQFSGGPRHLASRDPAL